MIEFTIMMIGYKIFGTKSQKQLYYFIVACLNFFLLYMTGCRTPAFVATAGAMLVFLINTKLPDLQFNWATLYHGGIYFIFNPNSSKN